MSKENKVIECFDEAAFEKWESNMMKHAQQFYEAITALQAEGIDVSVKSISEYPVKFKGLAEGEPREYQNHFRKLYEDAERRAGWLPKAELNRMFDNFMSVCNKTINAAEKICIALNFGLILTEDKGTATPDTERTAEAHKKDLTYRVNASAMGEHWAMLAEVRDKLDALKQWEMEHKMPPVSNEYDFGSFCAFIHRKIYNEQEMTMTEQEHNNKVWSYFKIKEGEK